MTTDALRAELVEARCWFDVDRVPGDPATTAWKRAARLAQARWREANDWPIGTVPYDGGSPVGSRLALDFARETGSNFLSARVFDAVLYRLAHREEHQQLDAHRLFADLLSSMPLCFNLFGECWQNEVVAAAAVTTWWPQFASDHVDLRFEHSPGRLDPTYLGNRSAFDACFLLGSAVVGVETKYHEHPKANAAPSATRLARYVEVTERSDAFVPHWREQVLGTELQQIWLDHLLLLSMLQHPSGAWSQGLFVLAYPEANVGFARVSASYREILRDNTTFEARTFESLLGGLPALVRRPFAERYRIGSP